MKELLNIVLVSFFCVATLNLNAQKPQGGGRGSGERPSIGVLYGTVLDSTSESPVEFATITLLSKKNGEAVTGGITDNKGRFHITEIPVGMYNVEVAFIGYARKIISDVKLSPRESVEVDLQKIYLDPSSVVIEDAEVVANKDLMRLEIDKRVFDVSENITATGGSANEILENIPSVEVDIDGNVSLRGSQNVTVLIDGKPSGLTGNSRQAVLDQLPASSIESVEIITNPSAKYDPDGMGGIINIILKKNKLYGYSGNVSLTLATGDNYNGALSLSKRNDKINVYGNYGFRYSDRFSETETDRVTNEESSDLILKQLGEGDRLRASHNFGLGTDLYLSPKSTLYASGSYQLRTGGEEDFVNAATDRLENGILEVYDRQLRENEEDENGSGIDLKLGYEIKFKPREKELSMDFSYSTSENEHVTDIRDVESSLSVEDYTERNEFNNSFDFYSGQLDYLSVIGENWKIETGVKATNRQVGNGFKALTGTSDFANLALDSARSNDFEYEEQIYSWYGITGRSFGKVGLQLGLRAEQAITDSYLVTTDSLFENDYFSLFPSGHLKYALSKEKEIMLSYSRRVNRPRTRQLNPFTDFSNPQLLRVGNPFLLPEYVDAMEASYSMRNKAYQLVTSVYYRKVNDVISRFITVDDNVSTVTYQNLENTVNQGLEVIFTWKKWKKWNIMMSANAYKTASDGSNVDSDLSNSGYAGNANTNVTWKNKGWQIQGSARYRAPFVILQGEIQSIFFSDLAVKKSVLKDKGTVGLRVSDLLDSREFNFETYGDNFTQEGRRKRESQNLYFTFSYNFGKLETKKRRSKGGSGGSGMDGMDM